MAGYVGVREPEHVWKLIAQESGDPASTRDYGTGLNSDKSTYHKGLKVEDFGKVSLLRNPNIANLMQRIEYIQKMATVIDYVREIMNLQYP